MAVTVGALGGGAQPAGSTAFAITFTGTSSSGDAIVGALGSSGTVVQPSGVACATPTLTLRKVATSDPANGQIAHLYLVQDAAACDTSTVATSTWGGTAQTKNQQYMKITGLGTANPEDIAAIGRASGNSKTPAVISGTMMQAANILIAICTSGMATVSHTWGTGWTQIGTTQQASGSSYTSAAYKIVAANTPQTAALTLGVAGNWSMLVVPLKIPAAGGFAIRESSLLDAVIGEAYTAQLHADNGTDPVLFDLSAGSLPDGLALDAGQPPGGGGTGSVLFAGVSPSGSGDNVFGGGTDPPTTADWTYAESQIGPGNSFCKIFPASWGGSSALPSSWASSGMVKGICDASPGTVPVLVWDTVMTSVAIHNFIDTIPAGQTVGFCWRNEPEGSGSAADYITGFNTQADIIHAAGRTRYDSNGIPSGLLMFTNAYTYQYRAGGLASALAGDWIPDPGKCDVYGGDVYQRQGASSWPSAGLSNYTQFQNWFNLVRGLGRPVAFAEYGINNCTSEALRNTRLQADWAWVRANFKPGGLSPYPLYGWMWWWRNMTARGPNAQDCYSWLRFEAGTATAATWKAILDSAGYGGGGGSGSSGGAITGTPTGPAGTASFTARATDSSDTPQVATQALSITVTASGTALAFDRTGALDGATLGTAYGGTVTTSGGLPPVTITNPGGGLPPGLAISAGGVFSGTPTAAGDYAFSLTAEDSTSPAPQTVTGSFSIHVADSMSITTLNLAGGQVGIPGQWVLGTSGGVAPFTWSLDNAAAPPGLALEPAGILGGTPTAAGVFLIPLSVSDSAGDTATGTAHLTIAPASGGLLPVGRRQFGGGSADWAGRFVGDVWDRAPYATVMFFNALEAGTQYTQLLSASGATIDTITTDAYGEFGVFYGPTDSPVPVLRMAADANGGAGPRRWIYCNDLPDLLIQLYQAVAAHIGGG